MDQEILDHHIRRGLMELSRTLLPPESCIDGRQSESFSGFGIPGATFGEAMTVIGALRALALAEGTFHEALDTVVRVNGGPGRCFFHTDARATQSVGFDMYPAAGCGHVTQARKDPQAYGLSGESMALISAYFQELKKAGGHEVVLPDSTSIPHEHNEKAVVVITGETSRMFSIRPTMFSEDGQLSQVFVYHRALHENRLAELSQALLPLCQRVDSTITEEKLFHTLQQMAAQQTNETVQRLALAKGLPVFEVQFDDRGFFTLQPGLTLESKDNS